jgi:DGQHR domain-containing protein
VRQLPPDAVGNEEIDNALIDRVMSIFKDSDFLTDRKVKIKTALGAQTDLDVCAWYEEVLVPIYCSSGRNISFQNLIDKWSSWGNGILAEKQSMKIESSKDLTFTNEALSRITKISVAVALDRYTPTKDMRQYAENKGIQVLTRKELDYYAHIVKALGKWTKYAIFKDLRIVREEENGSLERAAIMVRQPGVRTNREMYLFTLPAHDLLPIAYVFRRSYRPEFAYQRMIREKRVRSIGAFLESGAALIPNAILIAFDEEVADEVRFSPNTDNPICGILTLPKKYCSAWIVDGQHRLYGFTRTKFCKPPDDSPAQKEKFELVVVGLKNLGREDQAKSFIDINDNQERIDATLLCDLTTLTGDLKHHLTWPSLLVKELNSREPWKDRIRILEIEKDRPISLAGFAKFALANELLKLQKDKETGNRVYTGPLFAYARFDIERSLVDQKNSKSLHAQVGLLARYFAAIRQHIEQKRPGAWDQPGKYGLTKTVAVNALLLVLNQILKSNRKRTILKNLDKYMAPVASLSFTSSMIAGYGTGWQAFRGLANRTIDVLNQHNKIQLERVSGVKKKKD